MIQDDAKSWRRDESARDEIPEVDLATTMRALRGGLSRQWRLIAAITITLTVLALAYILLATPQYTARAALVVDPRIANSLTEPEAPTLLLSDALVVDSELKVLASREVTTKTAGDMGLFEVAAEDEGGGPVAMLKDAVRAILPARAEAPQLSEADAEASRREAIRRTMMEGFDITRDGGTYVIDIAYSSEDPVFAMNVVNTLIDSYFQVSADASLSDTRRIASWLDQRVVVLAGEVQQADRAVADYRRENDLYTMHDNILPSEAELTSATDRVIALRSNLIELQTRQDKIMGIVESHSVAALMDGTLGGDVASPALRDFQTRLARLVAEERDLVSRWGAESDIVTRNREDQRQLRELILDEAAQIGERMDTQGEAIRREIATTEAQVEELRTRASADAEKSIRLSELERDAEAKRTQYGSMLNEMISAAQRETFQRAPARVIARAVPPDEVSSPRGTRLLVLTVFAGLVLGSGLGFLREASDDRLRRPADLREGLGLHSFGLVPGVAISGRRLRRPATLLAPPPASNHQARRNLRSIMAQMQRAKPAQGALVTGLGAITRAAGRQNLAGWLAGSLVETGDRVLVLDLDPAGNGPIAQLTDRVRLSALQGGMDIEAEIARLTEALPGNAPVVAGLPENANLLVQSQQRGLAALLAALRPHFDHIIVILPPLSDRAESEITAALADGVLLVVRWGETSREDASEALAAGGSLSSRLMGAVFTADNDRGFRRYS